MEYIIYDIIPYISNKCIELYCDVVYAINPEIYLKVLNIYDSDYNNIIFIHALRNNRIDAIKLMLELNEDWGINPALSDNYPIRWAAAHGNIEIIKLLLNLSPERGIDISARDNDALRWAIYGGNYDIIDYLLLHNRNN